MKKLLFALVLIVSQAHAQKVQQAEVNEKIYKVGDTITIGIPTKDNGNFVFIDNPGTELMTASTYNPQGSENESHLSGLDLVIKKIKIKKAMGGNKKVYLYLGNGYRVDIKMALRVGEVLED